MKPIVTIDDFRKGIVDDDTLAVTDGFAMVRGLNLTSELGVAKLAYAWTTYANLQRANNFVKWEIDNRPNSITNQYGITQLLASNNPFTGVEIKNLQRQILGGTDWSDYFSSASYAPVFHEICVFNNRLVFSNGVDGIRTRYGWTTGNVAALTCTNGSATVSVVTASNTGCDPIAEYAAG
jgi:hypothetical protein